MPIIDIADSKQQEIQEEAVYAPPSRKDRLFSFLTTRLLFVLLLLANFAWAIWGIGRFICYTFLLVLSAFRSKNLQKRWHKSYVALKRSAVCGISLVLAIFNPSLGIMVACTYFLMYDPSAIQEVVPRSLREQFKEFSSSQASTKDC